MMILAHARSALSLHELRGEWQATPAEAALVLATAAWYGLGVRALWARAGIGHGITRRQAAAFAGGLLALVAALMSPLDALAEALFSAHMVQHLVLILVVAPLLVAGAPVVPMVFALPRPARRATGRWWRAHPLARSATHALTAPGMVFVLHLMALWFWHFPGPYQLALESPLAHAIEHASFLVTAMLFWWVVAPPVGRRRTSDGAAIALVVGTLMQGGALGALLMFATSAWYPAHAAGARALGVTPLGDQQLAGLIMWIPPGFVYVGTAAVLFLRWMRRDERAGAIGRDSRDSMPAPSLGALP